MNDNPWLLLIFLVVALSVFLSIRYRHIKKTGDLSLTGYRIIDKKFKCGHIASYEEVTEADRKFQFHKRSLSNGYCPNCFEEAAILCAWCKEPIYPGDLITLKTHWPAEDGAMPTHAHVYSYPYEQEYGDRSIVKVVGCHRLTCAETKEAYAGYWDISGHVHPFARTSEEAQKNTTEPPRPN